MPLYKFKLVGIETRQFPAQAIAMSSSDLRDDVDRLFECFKCGVATPRESLYYVFFSTVFLKYNDPMESAILRKKHDLFAFFYIARPQSPRSWREKEVERGRVGEIA